MLPANVVYYGKLKQPETIYQHIGSCLGHAEFNADIVNGDGNKQTPFIFDHFQTIRQNDHVVTKESSHIVVIFLYL